MKLQRKGGLFALYVEFDRSFGAMFYQWVKSDMYRSKLPYYTSKDKIIDPRRFLPKLPLLINLSD